MRGLFSSCSEQGLPLVAVCELLIVAASLVARALGARASVVVTRRLSSCGSRALEHKLSSCGARAYLLPGMWDLPGPGLEPVSPALAGGFLTTVPPGKPPTCFLKCYRGTAFFCSVLAGEDRAVSKTQLLFSGSL